MLIPSSLGSPNRQIKEAVLANPCWPCPAHHPHFIIFQGKLDHSQEEANKAESLDGVSEQCDDIARRFGRPGRGESLCKVTH